MVDKELAFAGQYVREACFLINVKVIDLDLPVSFEVGYETHHLVEIGDQFEIDFVSLWS